VHVRVPVLGLFGGGDENIPPDQIEEFDRNLDVAGVEHDIVVYPGAPHSFFDRKYDEWAEACDDAWRRTLAFLQR
jgi:carboxymethylenebutenolidase